MNKKKKAELRFCMDVVKTFYWRKLYYLCGMCNDDIWEIDNSLYVIMDAIERGEMKEAISMIYNKNMHDGFENLLDPDYKDEILEKIKNKEKKRNGVTNQSKLFGGGRNLSKLISIGKESCRLI